MSQLSLVISQTHALLTLVFRKRLQFSHQPILIPDPPTRLTSGQCWLYTNPNLCGAVSPEVLARRAILATGYSELNTLGKMAETVKIWASGIRARAELFLVYVGKRNLPFDGDEVFKLCLDVIWGFEVDIEDEEIRSLEGENHSVLRPVVACHADHVITDLTPNMTRNREPNQDPSGSTEMGSSMRQDKALLGPGSSRNTSPRGHKRNRK